MTKARQAAINADQALQMLKDGNSRFVSGNMEQRDLRCRPRPPAAMASIRWPAW